MRPHSEELSEFPLMEGSSSVTRDDSSIPEPSSTESERLMQHGPAAGQPKTAFSIAFLSFSWVWPLIRLGGKRQLQPSDLPDLPEPLSPSKCGRLLWELWGEEVMGSRRWVGRPDPARIRTRPLSEIRPSLIRAMYRGFGWPYLVAGIFKLLLDAVGFLGPVMLNFMLAVLSTTGRPIDWWAGVRCALGIGALSAFGAVAGSHYRFQVTQVSMKMRAAITTLVFRKALLHVSLAQAAAVSSGTVQTHMSVDAERTVNLCMSVHELWGIPLQIMVALALLYWQVRWAFLAGLAVVIALIPVNKWIADLISAASERMMKHKDERVRCTGEMLRGIQSVKAMAWEPVFLSRILASREKELDALAVRKYLDAFCVYFWACTPVLFSLATFTLCSQALPCLESSSRLSITSPGSSTAWSRLW